jgi:hypothetical protein
MSDLGYVTLSARDLREAEHAAEADRASCVVRYPPKTAADRVRLRLARESRANVLPWHRLDRII